MNGDGRGPESPKKYEGLSQYRPPLNYELVGKTLELVMDDGYDYELTFADRKTLRYGRAGGELKEYAYDCLKADDDTYFVNFELTGAVPRAGQTFVLDMEQSLVTACRCTVGQNPRYPRMTKPVITFGAVRREDGTVPGVRHGYTHDLVGKAIHWRYGTLAVVHVYASERYYRLTHTEADLAKLKQREPQRYEEIKNRNTVTVYEEPCSMGNYPDINDRASCFTGNDLTAGTTASSLPQRV